MWWRRGKGDSEELCLWPSELGPLIFFTKMRGGIIATHTGLPWLRGDEERLFWLYWQSFTVKSVYWFESNMHSISQGGDMLYDTLSGCWTVTVRHSCSQPHSAWCHKAQMFGGSGMVSALSAVHIFILRMYLLGHNPILSWASEMVTRITQKIRRVRNRHTVTVQLCRGILGFHIHGFKHLWTKKYF
jgi:hypothetical protein